MGQKIITKQLGEKVTTEGRNIKHVLWSPRGVSATMRTVRNQLRRRNGSPINNWYHTDPVVSKVTCSKKHVYRRMWRIQRRTGSKCYGHMKTTSSSLVSQFAVFGEGGFGQLLQKHRQWFVLVEYCRSNLSFIISHCNMDVLHILCQNYEHNNITATQIQQHLQLHRQSENHEIELLWLMMTYTGYSNNPSTKN